MSEIIGFIGLGHMGRAMASNLLKAGYKLRVYNRDTRKAEPLVAEGAQLVKHPGEAVEPEGIVITMVADDAALEDVTLGPDGILEHLGPGGIHISMSTVSPAMPRQFLAGLMLRQPENCGFVSLEHLRPSNEYCRFSRYSVRAYSTSASVQGTQMW